MSPDDLIDSYLGDVAASLPRRQRQDIVLELRSLLRDEVADRGAAAGREPDEALALDVVRAFGRPDEVARRYLPEPSLVDTADRGRVGLLALVGAVVVGIVAYRSTVGAGMAPIVAVQAFWLRLVVGTGGWTALLVLGFAGVRWARRHRPRTDPWSPRPAHHDPVNRWTVAVAVLGMAAGITALVIPGVLLDLAVGGRAAPAAHRALAYDATFLRWGAPLMLALLAGTVGLRLVLLVRGRWQPLTRRIEIGLGLAFCAALTVALFAGSVFEQPATDRAAKELVGLVVIVSVLDTVRKLRHEYHRVRPLGRIRTS